MPADPLIDRVIENDPIQRAVACAEIAELRVRFHLTATPRRKAPANAHPQQHGYYRAVVLPVVRRFLNETEGGMPDEDANAGFRDFTHQEAHDWIKTEAAREGVIGRRTASGGVVIPSCADMTAVVFYRFVDYVIDRMRREDYVVPPADKEWKQARERAMAAEATNQRKAS